MRAAFWVIVGLGAIPWVIPSGGARRIVARHPQVIFIRLLETTTVFLYVLVAQVLERRLALLGPENAVAGWAGVAITLAEVALTTWAKVVLRGSFSLSLGIREGHELITAGPYSRMRHPIYTGILVAMAGAALVFDSGAVLLCLAAPFGVFFYWQTVVEEKLLEAHFGAAYVEYRQRAGRFLPRVNA